MPFDLEAIKRKLEKMQGNGNSSRVQMWKPELGQYRIRALPWPNTDPSNPIVERWWYYLGNMPGMLAPHQFDKPDPIHEMMGKLYERGTPDDRNLAKKLHPKMRAYLPVIVKTGAKANPDAVIVWAFGKGVYQRLLSFFVNPDIGDFLDPVDGFDIDVTITQAPGKQYPDTAVDVARRQTPLSKDPIEIKKFLDAVPNIDDMYQQKTYEQVKETFDRWLNADEKKDDNTAGTSRGDSSADELDKLAQEVKQQTKPKQEDVETKHEDDLAKQFDDLMKED